MKFSELLIRFPRIYLISHVVIWFGIGMIISYLLLWTPMFKEIEYFNIVFNLAGWFAMIFGFLGGIYILLNYPEKHSN